jgi:hypothetical protein
MVDLGISLVKGSSTSPSTLTKLINAFGNKSLTTLEENGA